MLQTAYRRSDLIESLHDGSFFAGDWTRLGVFLPTGVAMLVLWLTGLWMWWVPFEASVGDVARPRPLRDSASQGTGGSTRPPRTGL